jgi:hypothetical protein
VRRGLVVLSLAITLAIPMGVSAQSPSPPGGAVLQNVCLSFTGPLVLSLEDLVGRIQSGQLTVTFAPCEGSSLVPVILPSAPPEPTVRPSPTPAATAIPTPRPRATPVPLSKRSWAYLKSHAKKPGYRSLLRNPDSYVDKPIYFKGKVLQAQDDGTGGQSALVSVTKGSYGLWDDNVAITYRGSPNIIADDIVEFVMTGTGNYGYESAGAGYLTVPSGDVVRLKLAH